MPDPDKPTREIDLDRPNAEVTKLYKKLPQNRTARTVQEAIQAYDQDRPVKMWFPESKIATYAASERIDKR